MHSTYEAVLLRDEEKIEGDRSAGVLTSVALRCGDMDVEKECTSKPVEAAALKLGSVEYTGSKVAISETTLRNNY